MNTPHHKHGFSSYVYGMREVLRVAIVATMLVASTPALAAVSCTATATGPAFGIYNPLNISPTLANGTVTTTCTLQSGFFANVALTISYGFGGSGNFSSRNMSSGASVLNYNLYSDATYTQVLGDGTGGSISGSANMFLFFFIPTQQVSSTIYGRVPAGQDVAAGSYTDMITVTITY